MIEKKGDVFTTEAKYIAHGCNVEGVMGAGVAATVRSRFPHAYDIYRAWCEQKMFNPGDCLAVEDNDKVILNLATQDQPGPHARYEWVRRGLIAAADNAVVGSDDTEKVVIAMPQIGAGIGGLEWDKVKELVEATEMTNPHVEFEVWEYQP